MVTVLHSLGLLNLPRHTSSSSPSTALSPWGLPDSIVVYPVGVLLSTGALASAASGLVGREDRWVTAGLLALVGPTQLSVAAGFSRRPGYVAVPIVTAVLAVVA